MSRFVKTLSLFLASLSAIPLKAGAMPLAVAEGPQQNLDPVQLRPLNFDMDNLFAAHRSHSSHSSHASHSSHYSGSSGGSYSEPETTPTPPRYPLPSNNLSPSTPSEPQRSPVETYRPIQSQPTPTAVSPQMGVDEKRMLQIMRVQMALTRLGLYSGELDGVLNKDTQQSLKLFQKIKKISETGLMTTETLNALGVMAVQ